MTEAMTEDAVFELLSLECRVGTDGTVHYYNAQGKLHRVHGPAVEYSNGRREWYQNGLRHRLGGPAGEYPNSYRAWWQNGQLHRVDGPAIEYANGIRAWYINDRKLTRAKWRQEVANMETV